MQSPDDNINLFFIQGQVIYDVLMPQASVRASLIVGLEYVEWNDRMEQWTYIVAANLVLLSVSWTTLCISRAVTSPHKLYVQVQQCQHTCFYIQAWYYCNPYYQVLCYCSLVKPDLRTKARVRFCKTLIMHNGIVFMVEISAQSQSPLQSLSVHFDIWPLL